MDEAMCSAIWLTRIVMSALQSTQTMMTIRMSTYSKFGWPWTPVDTLGQMRDTRKAGFEVLQSESAEVIIAVG